MIYVKTRKEALATGKDTYFTGVPCKYGHNSPRLTHSWHCIECIDRSRLLAIEHRKTDEGKQARKNYYHKVRSEQVEHILLQSARRRARTRNVPCNITKQDILDIWPSDNLCPIFGIEMKHNYDNTSSHSHESPSLDCIIPSIGYVVGNIAIISTKANMIKNDVIDPLIFRKMACWLDENIHQDNL